MKTYFVDAFTSKPFKGNPAAVCMPENDLTAPMMQNIAAEIGFSETAFIRHDSGNRYSIRFFTPKTAIDLCGHATLASSKIVFDTTTLQDIVFVNGQEIELKISKAGNAIVMQFPVYETNDITVPAQMLDALGIIKCIETRYNSETKSILIEMADVGMLASLQPDFAALLKTSNDISGVLVTARSQSDEYDFHYRYFWPWAGTNEDPVTGAVQTFLTKYWATKLQKNKLKAFQSSARTGSMTTALLPDKVLIYGEAVTVLEGEFKIPGI